MRLNNIKINRYKNQQEVGFAGYITGPNWTIFINLQQQPAFLYTKKQLIKL